MALDDLYGPLVSKSREFFNPFAGVCWESSPWAHFYTHPAGWWNIGGRKHLADQFPPRVLLCPLTSEMVLVWVVRIAGKWARKQNPTLQYQCGPVWAFSQTPNQLQPRTGTPSARTFLKAGLSPAGVCKLLNSAQRKKKCFVRTIISLSEKEKKNWNLWLLLFLYLKWVTEFGILPYSKGPSPQ